MPLLLQFLKFLVLLPVGLQLKIGALLGYLFFIFGAKRKKIIETNLLSCFKDKTKTEIKKITRANCINMGKGLMEVAMTFWLSDNRLKKISQISGLEHIAKAKEAHKAIIFLPAHFTPMLIAGRILHLYERLTIIYYTQNNPKFNQQMQKSFKKHQFNSIDNFDLRSMINTINQKESLWLPCDQDYGEKNSVYSTFFGQKAATITTPARIAKNKEVIFLPVRYFRKKNHYQVMIEPPLENYPTQNSQKNADVFNQMIEVQVRQNIEQYLWAHRRFKTQPDSKNFYL